MKILTLTVSVAIFWLILGCVPLQPGADPVVVRAEQAESGAFTTFTSFLQFDDANRALLVSKAPAVHNFAEYLREPTVVGTNSSLPRNIAFIISLDQVKRDYKAGRATSNALDTATTTLISVLNQVNIYIGSSTNK